MRARAYLCSRPKRPLGLKISTNAMIRNIAPSTNSGKPTLPKARVSPRMIAATNAPAIEPMPPITVTMKDSITIEKPMPGVSERTAFRRLEDAAFKARVAELRSAMVRTAAGRLVDGMTEAAGVLRAGLTDPDANIRHKSAVKLIELGVKVTELAELEQRVEELEQLIRQKERP